MKLPGISAYEVNELLPKFDCGLCGNPLCMTLARRVLNSAQGPEECPYISKDNLAKVQNIMTKLASSERKTPRRRDSEELVEIFPCTEDGKVTLEVQLGLNRDKPSDDFFDEYQLCACLSEARMFDKINCSPKMGYALVEMSGKRTHIFKTGKIIMRRANSTEDALNTLGMLSRLLLPARLAMCDNLLVDCFGGGCSTCSEENESIRVLDVLDGDDSGMNKKLVHNFRTLSIFVNELRSTDKSIRDGGKGDMEALRKRNKELVDQINENCVQVLMNDGASNDTILALIQYGLARNLARAGSGLIGLENANTNGLYDQAVNLLFTAFEAFEALNLEDSETIKESYLEFMTQWKKQSSPMELVKIATNGFYIARLLGGTILDIRLENDYHSSK